MQAAPTRPPLGVVFDTSLDGDIDQVLALAMLFGLDSRRQVRLAALSTSRFNRLHVAFLDLVARFYRGEQSPDTVVERLSQPIGMPTQGPEVQQAAPMVSAVLARHVADGRGYTRGRAALNDTADPVALIRNALSAQADQNAAVILSGSPANLLDVIARPDGRQWVSRKARVLAVAAGRFAPGPPDAVVRREVETFRRLLAEWPSPIVAAGTELSDQLPFPGRSLESGIAWAPYHPIVDAYTAVRPAPYDAPSRTLAAILHAVGPDQPYFELSSPGTITIDDDGRTTFAAAAGGRHRYLIVKAEQKERVVQTYAEMVTAQPPPRPGRGGARPGAAVVLEPDFSVDL